MMPRVIAAIAVVALIVFVVGAGLFVGMRLSGPSKDTEMAVSDPAGALERTPSVIVSALNFPGNERLVLELALRGRFEFYLSRFILEEVAGVLVRKFGWGEERTTEAVLVLETAANVIEPPQMPEVMEMSNERAFSEELEYNLLFR